MLNTQDQRMPCPVPGCDGEIAFNTYKLLEGAKFVCTNCKGAIGIATESREQVEETMGQFEQMRKKLLKMKNNPTNT